MAQILSFFFVFFVFAREGYKECVIEKETGGELSLVWTGRRIIMVENRVVNF